LESPNLESADHGHCNTSKRRRTGENAQQSLHYNINGLDTWEPVALEHAPSYLSSSQSFGGSSEQNNQSLEGQALTYFSHDIDLVANQTTASPFISHGEQSSRPDLTSEGELQWAVDQRPVDNYSDWGAGAINDVDYHQYAPAELTG
jgi:hypothetical protein